MPTRKSLFCKIAACCSSGWLNCRYEQGVEVAVVDVDEAVVAGHLVVEEHRSVGEGADVVAGDPPGAEGRLPGLRHHGGHAVRVARVVELLEVVLGALGGPDPVGGREVLEEQSVGLAPGEGDRVVVDHLDGGELAVDDIAAVRPTGVDDFMSSRRWKTYSRPPSLISMLWAMFGTTALPLGFQRTRFS